MSERIYPIFYENRKIYFSDWTNISSVAQALAIMEETTNYIKQLNELNLLEIVDVTNSYATVETLMAIKKIAKEVKKFSKKKAMLGITGAKKVLLNSVNNIANTQIRAFDSKEEALEWLVKD